jgi:hypothetical protein
MGETQLSFQQLTGQYQPRRPEETVLYQAVARNFRTLEAIAESAEAALNAKRSAIVKSFIFIPPTPL